MISLKHGKWMVVVAYGLLVVGLLYYIEQILLLPYVAKTLIKLPLFTLLPWWLLRRVLGDRLQIRLERPYVRGMLGGCMLVAVGLVGGFLLIRNSIDVSAIADDLNHRMKIGGSLMVLAALYTTFINSFIEEYFFRGLLFLGLKHQGKKGIGYLASSLLFALYHVTIFLQWFSWPMMVVAIGGLVIGGLIFAWFADRTDSLLGAWLIHITADAVLMILGMLVLGIGF